jgi:hypothetical protein
LQFLSSLTLIHSTLIHLYTHFLSGSTLLSQSGAQKTPSILARLLSSIFLMKAILLLTSELSSTRKLHSFLHCISHGCLHP